MHFDQALKKLASKIFDYHDPKAIYCIVPSKYSSKKNPSHDCIFKEIKATHYKRTWQKPGESVKLTFYSAESFGASLDLEKKVFETVVELKGKS